VTNRSLINDLEKRTRWTLDAAHAFEQLSDADLNRRPGPEQWNALECLDHLNRYGDYYLPEIERVAKAAPRVAEDAAFHTGWLGNKFALSMRPGGAGTSMKTFKKMNPLGDALKREVLREFIRQQEEMLRLLALCRTVNLSKAKTGTTLTRYLRLRLGDTLRVVIYHNQRHLEQAQRAVAFISADPGVELSAG